MKLAFAAADVQQRQRALSDEPFGHPGMQVSTLAVATKDLAREAHALRPGVIVARNCSTLIRSAHPASVPEDADRSAEYPAGTRPGSRVPHPLGRPYRSARGRRWRWVPTRHTHGMARTRLSTTVDADLLDGARRVRSGVTDATLIDEALQALLVRRRAAEVDASYAAYDEHPLDERDEWGDLASFRQAAAAS